MNKNDQLMIKRLATLGQRSDRIDYCVDRLKSRKEKREKDAEQIKKYLQEKDDNALEMQYLTIKLRQAGVIDG